MIKDVRQDLSRSTYPFTTQYDQGEKIMFTVEFRDLAKRERVLFETDDRLSYAWALYALGSQPFNFTVIKATPLMAETGPGEYTIQKPVDWPVIKVTV